MIELLSRSLRLHFISDHARLGFIRCVGEDQLALPLSYTQALDSNPPENRTFVRDAHWKRAFANLTAKFVVAAKDDALASRSDEDRDEKVYYCAGRAAYELGAYAESKEYFENALKLDPSDLRYKKELKPANYRMREEKDRVYDFRAMVTSVTGQNVHLDHADWMKNIVIQTTDTHGRGLFVARNLEAGSLVLCEKAFCLPNQYSGELGSDLVMYCLNTNSRTQRPAQTALFLQLAQKPYNNSYFNKSFFDLDCGGYLRLGKEEELVNRVPIVDL
jgi:tetratricopeptide (TPR) repeat protein